MKQTKKDNKSVTKDRIKALLQERGMNQQSLADEIPLTAQYFSAMINGHRNFQVDVAKRIAEILPPVRYQWIMGEDDFKTERDLIEHSEKNTDKVYLAIENLVDGLGFGLYAENLEESIPVNKIPSECTLFLYNDYENISVGEYTQADIMNLFEEIADFAEFKIKKLIERSVTDG